MDDASDQQLLRDFSENQSETAFAELVHRHIDLVYSAALRLVVNPHLAQEVTQGVFVALAQNAGKLADRPVLAGWLHRTAQNLAANVVRSEVRRRAREQEAVAMNDLSTTDTAPDWEAISPQLDVALGELNEADRDAVLLRYFNRKSAREIGEIFGTSEEAAQKRVHRAVEKLRENLARRGVAVGAGGLASAISAHAVQAAPSALAALISAAPVSTAVTAAKVLFMTTTQKILVTTVIAAALGLGVFEAHQATQLSDQNRALQQQQAPLADMIQQLQRERDDASNRLARLAAASLRSQDNSAELLKLRNEVTRLKSENAALASSPREAQEDPTQSAAKKWLDRVQHLRDYVKAHPETTIPEMRLLSDRDWLNAADHDIKSEKDYRRAIARLRDAVSGSVGNQIFAAIQKYELEAGQPLTDVSQLQGYFKTPLDADILQRWVMVPASAIPSLHMGGDWVITQQTAVDDEYDSRYGIGPNGYGNSGPGSYKEQAPVPDDVKVLQSAVDAYAAANHGSQPATPAQIEPYLSTPEQKAAYQRFVATVKANGLPGNDSAAPETQATGLLPK